MKKTLEIIATASILLFGILWISSKFDFLTEYNSIDFRNILVLIYLFTSLKYFRMKVKDKNAEILELKRKLEKSEKEIIGIWQTKSEEPSQIEIYQRGK